MTNPRWFDPESIASAGNMGASQMQAGFTALRPTAQIAKMVGYLDKLSDPERLDALSALGTALESLNRLLAAARFETSGTRGDLLRLGLVKVQADMLRVWLEDDDPGLARTMAQLDRSLRDTESLAERLETPFKIIGGLMRAFRSATPKPQQDGSNATAD